MAQIRLWAPQAIRVELACQGQLFQMKKAESGWWSMNAPFIHQGIEYWFRIDGKGPFPDPRSPWQPEGVHGPSKWVDHTEFSWSDAEWQQKKLEDGILYELHIGTFTPDGTFESAIDRLEYLIDLGVTHIELMPIAEFPGRRGWGYDGTDLYAPHHIYGGPLGLKRLVDACHRKGLAVLLDVVYNHLGPSGNYLGQFGPYFTSRYKTPWGEAVNFDGPDCDEVRQFFIDNALMWMRDYHIDGLRIDAVHAIFDTSAFHFLEQLVSEVRHLEQELDRRLVLIAESNRNDPRMVRSTRLGGYGLDAQWNDDFHHALQAILTGERTGYYQDFGKLAEFTRVLTHGFAYDGRYSLYRRQTWGRSAAGLSGDRFVAYLQNHDQVGNRVRGDRISHLLSLGQLKIGAALVMTSPFVPMLFQGEEWGASSPFLYFTDHQDPRLAQAVRSGRQREFTAFGWEPEEIPDPQANETFQRSRLNWGEQERTPHSELLQWYRSLIRLRSGRLSDLRNEDFKKISARFSEQDHWLTMKRGSLLIACNFGKTEQSIRSPVNARTPIVLSSENGVIVDENRILLPGRAVVILDLGQK